MVSQLKSSERPLAKNRRWKIYSKPWLLLIVTVLVIGIFFRFANLDNKILWFDETQTILKISGYTAEEWKSVNNNLNGQLLNGQIVRIKDFQESYSPDPQSNVIDIIELLSIEDSKHTPLYFAILRLWVDWFGNSAAVMRSLSALISLLIFPCTYWLCLELFQSPLVGWIAVALLAVSPFQVLYAQDARPYSLLIVTILLSSVTLLRAIRLKTKLSWGLYTISWSLSIYTHTLSLFVFIAHSIYVAATCGIQRSKVSIAYLISSLVGLLTFTPWLFFILTNYDKVSESVEWQGSVVRSFSYLVNNWIIYLSRIFIDYNPIAETDSSSFQNPLSIFVRWVVLIVVGYSIYFICRHSSRRIWLFIVTLIGITALALAIPDILFGGQRSCQPRYLTASYLGIHLAIAYLLGTKIALSTHSIWRQKFWQVLTVVIISVGVLSCAIISPAETWWNKYSREIPVSQISKTINQSTYPLVLFESKTRHEMISISPLLQSEVRLLQLGESGNITIPEKFNNIFLLNPSEELQNRLQNESKFKIEPIYQDYQGYYLPSYSFWQLERSQIINQ